MSLGAVGPNTTIRTIEYAEYLAGRSADLQMAMRLLGGLDVPGVEREALERMLWEAQAAAEAASQYASRLALRDSRAPF